MHLIDLEMVLDAFLPPRMGWKVPPRGAIPTTRQTSLVVGGSFKYFPQLSIFGHYLTQKKTWKFTPAISNQKNLSETKKHYANQSLDEGRLSFTIWSILASETFSIAKMGVWGSCGCGRNSLELTQDLSLRNIKRLSSSAKSTTTATTINHHHHQSSSPSIIIISLLKIQDWTVIRGHFDSKPGNCFALTGNWIDFLEIAVSW